MLQMSPVLRVIGGCAISSVACVAASFTWTRNCEAKPLDPDKEPLYKSPYYEKYNPYNNISYADVISRRISLKELRLDLREDTQSGGSKLVDTFCGSIWSGFCFTPQRLIHTYNKPFSSLPPPPVSESTSMPKNANTSCNSATSDFNLALSPCPIGVNDTTTTGVYLNGVLLMHEKIPQDLWTCRDLISSSYNPGTVITNHFIILSRTPASILIRCGDSPLSSPYTPRASDGLLEISATIDSEMGFVEFSLKSIFFNGTEENRGATMVFNSWVQWLHQRYGKMLLEEAVERCMQN